jgi:glutathione transport system substrate-binding protein
MKKQKFAFVFGLAFLVLLQGAYAGGGSQAKTGSGTAAAGPTVIAPGQSISQTRDIVAACTVDFTTMDPVDTSDTLSGGIQRFIMDGLFAFDDDMNLVNALATGYEANANATEYIIKLRQGISFTDGTPWDADALIANIAKWDDKSLALKRTALLADVLDSWQKVDTYTVKVQLTQPFGAFISTLAHPACVIMSPKQIAKGVNVTAEQPVGTGQYKFVEWVRADHLKLELNKEWWGYDPARTDGKPFAERDAGFKTITFKPVPEGATRTAMVQSGDAQIMWNIPAADVSVLEKDANLSVGNRKSLVAYYIWLNNQKKPFTDKRVRQALNYAFNNEAYLAVVESGIGSLPTTIIGPNTQFAKEEPAVPYDVAKAKALLAEAGYPNGFKTKLMAINTSANQKAGEFIRQQFAQVGVDVELVLAESALMNARVQDVSGPGDTVEMEMYISGWSSSTGDADWALRPLFASESIPPLNYNLAYYQNPAFDAFIRQALESADPEVRKNAYAKAQDLLWDDMPVVVRHIGAATWVTSKKIINVSIYPDGAMNLRAGRMSP